MDIYANVLVLAVNEEHPSEKGREYDARTTLERARMWSKSYRHLVPSRAEIGMWVPMLPVRTVAGRIAPVTCRDERQTSTRRVDVEGAAASIASEA